MLGVPGDLKRHYVYPFGGNVCYARPAGVWQYGGISRERQKELCLSDRHEQCPNYQKCAEQEPSAMRPSSWFQRAVTIWRTKALSINKGIILPCVML